LITAGGLVTARLTPEERNGRLSAEGAARLVELFEHVEDDDSAQVLAITGSGRTFCTGFAPGVTQNLVESLAVVTKPTIAILNGDAIDEGLELAMAADLRVASTQARFALTQLERGTLPHYGGTQRLPRLVGPGHALRMILTGASIDGIEAHRIGLVAYLAATESELADVSGSVVEAILSRAPLAARLVKDAVIKGYDMTLEQGVRLEEDLYALLQTTADRAEGVRAFLEKRKPLFRGA